jgi:hypothetical protein
MLGTPYQTKLTFLANLLTFLRILLQWKLDYDMPVYARSACSASVPASNAIPVPVVPAEPAHSRTASAHPQYQHSALEHHSAPPPIRTHRRPLDARPFPTHIGALRTQGSYSRGLETIKGATWTRRD